MQATTGEVAPLDSTSPRADEKASVGLYSVRLARYGVGVEITAARRAALYRLRYPAGAKANLLFDVGHFLLSGMRTGEWQSLVDSEIEVLSPTEVAGSTSVKGGWNKQPNAYTVYFYARIDTPAASWGTWLDGNLKPGSKSVNGQANSKSGAWLTFEPKAGRPVLMKIGISFISVEQARGNLAAEIPVFDFAATHAAALAKWNRALSKIEIKGATPEQAQIFYTALYHTMLMPTDRSGENPLWKSAEPYYDDYYAIWDIFRTSGPLLTLIAPERETGDRALAGGHLPPRWLLA